MVFLYHGRDAGLTLHVLKKDMAKKGEDYLSSTRYDAYRDPVGDVVSDCLSLSLFGDKKVVVLSNCYFLTQAIKSAKGAVKEAEQDYAGLLSLPGLSDASFATSWPTRVILKAVFLTVSQRTSKLSPLQDSRAVLTTPGPLTPTFMTASGSLTP